MTLARRLRPICGAMLLPFLLLLLTPAMVHAQYTYTTNATDTNTIRITGYSGSGGEVTIPSTINGLSVTGIGQGAFEHCTSLTSVTIPNSVTNIGGLAFYVCYGLTNVMIPDSVTSIGSEAFSCSSLVHVMIGNGVINLGSGAFYNCTSLTNITIPNAVTSIGDCAFASCTSMISFFFKGDAPAIGLSVFYGDNNATVYYLPGTTNWGSTFGDCPTAVWKPQISGDTNFGVRTNQFGFNINWASGMVVVVEACTNLADAAWFPLQTNTLNSDSSYFDEPNWINNAHRFYRLVWQ
jgi:hypothetical protein